MDVTQGTKEKSERCREEGHCPGSLGHEEEGGVSPQGSFRFPRIPEGALQKSPTRTTNRPGRETLLESLPPPHTKDGGEKVA